MSPPNPSPKNGSKDAQSVRSGSGFWADGRSQTPSSSAFFSDRSLGVLEAGNDSGIGHALSPASKAGSRPGGRGEHRTTYHTEDDDDNDSQGTEVPGGSNEDDGVIDEVGAQDAFVAGMIYALSRRIAPGSSYTPSWAGEDVSSPESERGRWRLEECLR